MKINKESADSPEPFLQEGKKQTQTIGQYNDTRSDNKDKDFLSSNTKSFPYPVLVSEISDQSQKAPDRYRSVSAPTKRSEINQ